MNGSAGTIFQSFNARFSDPETVGAKFVQSPHLGAVATSSHTAVLGPRGSGKTTLLKMLTLPALLKWRGEQRNELISGMNFLAVYIPASLTWSADYRSFSADKMDPAIERILSISLFRHSALISMVETWVDATTEAVRDDDLLSKYYAGSSQEDEVTQVRQIAKAWGIELETSTRVGLRRAITSRLKLLQRLSVEASLTNLEANTVVTRNEFLARNFLDDASDFADFLEDITGKKTRLALCFDELEIAADSVASTILRAPRSIDQRLFVKFSAAPYVTAALGAADPTVPTERNDFQLVFLSSYSTLRTRQFSEALFSSLAAVSGSPPSPPDVFGKSFLDDDLTDGEGKYKLTGQHGRKFGSLYEKDSSFREYADQRGISVQGLSEGSEFRRAADVRKILWPVLIREEFLFSQEGVSQNRTRRFRSKDTVSDIYTGADSLFALCEGNPRWIIGLMEPMIKEYRVDISNGAVKRSHQKVAIERMMAAFFALLSTIPSSPGTRELRSLVDLVDRIGMFFRASVLGAHFNPDPVLSFRVDESVEASVQELVGRGINIGAFVTRAEPHERPYRVGEISGLRVRLSHIFAPRFRLPLIVGRTVNLSTILERKGSSQNQSSLLDLFGKMS